MGEVVALERITHVRPPNDRLEFALAALTVLSRLPPTRAIAVAISRVRRIHHELNGIL